METYVCISKQKHSKQSVTGVTEKVTFQHSDKGRCHRAAWEASLQKNVMALSL